MALTMTRTRTQTALTHMAQKLAEVRGELQFVNYLALELPVEEVEVGAALARRRDELAKQEAALVVTLRQFDAGLDTDSVGAVDTWRRGYRARTESGLRRRYLRRLGV